MKSKFTQLIILALAFRLILAFMVWHPDVNNHIDWGERFFEYGAGEFYSPDSNVWSYTWPNQPPGTILLFAATQKLYKFVFSVFWFANENVPPFPSATMFFLEDRLYPALLKLPAILSDFGIAYLIYRILTNLSTKRNARVGVLMWLLNPVVWYNSALWGQTDAIINYLSLAAFYFLFRRQLLIATTMLALSYFIKVSLVIFAPIFVIIAIKQKYSLNIYLKSLVLPFVLVGLLTMPFARGEPYTFLYTVITERVLTEQLHVITANAFNIWAAIAGIHERPNSFALGPLSYAAWGMAAFALFYLPLLYKVFRQPKEEVVYWVLALTAFTSFILLTNMHERYLYPLFPLFTILAAQYANFRIMYWVVSLISLANLYNFWWTPRIEPIVVLLSSGDRIAPRILGLAMTIIFVLLYRQFFVRFSKALPRGL